jgi:hypothetical protein
LEDLVDLPERVPVAAVAMRSHGGIRLPAGSRDQAGPEGRPDDTASDTPVVALAAKEESTYPALMSSPGWAS